MCDFMCHIWRKFLVLLLIFACSVSSFCPVKKLCELQTAYHIQGNITFIIPTICSQHTPFAKNCVFIEQVNKIICSENQSDGFTLTDRGLQFHDVLSIVHVNTMLVSSTIDYFMSRLEKPHFRSSLIKIISPPFGSIANNLLNITVNVSKNHYNHVYFNVIGIINNTIPSSALSNFPLLAENIEPASWFYTLTPVRDSAFSIDSFGGESEATFFAMRDTDSLNDKLRTKTDFHQHGYPSYGYIEFVLSDDEIRLNRRYGDRRREDAVQFEKEPESVRQLTENVHSSDLLNVCVWSSVKMDGQKSIWLQQTRHMDRSRFRFVWILTLAEGGHVDVRAHPELLGSESVYKYLLQIQEEQRRDGLSTAVLSIVDSPYNGFVIDRDDLHTAPGDGSPPAKDMWGGDVTLLYKYAHDRLLAAHFVINHITPLWCRAFYLTMQSTLSTQKCDVVVFGNSRGFSSDVFITDTARLMGVPSASELLNLYLHVDVLPDAVVGPSAYAVEHHSIASVGEVIARHSAAAKNSTAENPYERARAPTTTVISPSVDSEVVFNPVRLVDKESGTNECEAFDSQGESNMGPCFRVGFVARLSPEKSPGLFLLAAHELLQLDPFARFVIVGEGLLRQSLEELAARLGISRAVSFLGWLGSDGDQLPSVLRSLDAVVNPSLRAWSETFCIANIEAMSMRIPLVTFAVGGVGEYVEDPVLRAGNLSKSASFSVGPNAVVVNTATPQAIAQALHFLIQHPQLRREIGAAGRRTVQQHFNVQRQMKQYESFYVELVSKK